MRRSSPATCRLAYERNWAGYDDVDAALDAVQDCGVVTAILTNGTQEQPEAKLAHLGLLGRMGTVLAAEGLGVAKPKRKKTRCLGHVQRVVASQLGSAGRSRPQ
jgi:FMN phosphatase YigB (HAD superfamily)